jgi:hypothetical protein
MHRTTGVGTLRLFLIGSTIAVLCGCASAPSPTKASPNPKPAPPTDIELVRLDLSATLQSRQTVAVDNPYGDVRLRFGGFKDEIEIHSVAQEPALAHPIALQPGVVDGRYLIAPRLPANTLVAEGQRLDLVVFVPLGHSVTARTERGIIESRGIRADIDLHSVSGDIAIRGTQGSIHAATGAGNIEASLLSAPPGAKQKLATSTGEIVLAVNDKLDADIEMATSAAFATEYSLKIDQLPGKEPNKRAFASIGEANSSLIVESRRGEIRLLRWTGFTSADGTPVEEDEQADTDSD